jgi:uncharacterized membrane protein
MSHPIHPAIVHFPITFLMTANLIDMTYHAATHPTTGPAIRTLYDLTPLLAPLARLSHLLTILGLLSALPAILTGAMELLKLLERQALITTDNNKVARRPPGAGADVLRKTTTHPKVRLAFAHAAMMDVAVLASAGSWWLRRGNDGVVPSGVNVAISGLVFVLLSVGGFAGSRLVYSHGVGVDLAGTWGKKQA